MSEFRKAILPNGIRVLTEHVPGLRSVSVGVWVTMGARDEDPAHHGISHFIEHMIFKGTQSRSALEIAKAFDSVGGHTNAFTSRETTCFHVRVLDEHLAFVLELLTDIFLNSRFDPLEVERERGVILQEIHMVEDTPDDLVFDLFGRHFWGDNGLGRSILGSPESVTRFDSERLRAYTREAYTAPRVLVTAAGSVRHEALVEAIAPAFTAVPVQGRPSARQPALPGTGAALHEKDLEQVHLVLGCRGPAAADPRRHAALLLNVMLGGSMSSRLFQEIREKRGLAYSVYSFLSPYEDAGLLGMYAGVAPGKAAEVAALAAGELERLASGGVTDRELDEAKSHLRGNLFLAMENTDTRMTRLARNEIHFGRFIPPEEALGTLEAVEPAEVQELAAWCREGGLAVAALGPIGEPDARALEALAVGA